MPKSSSAGGRPPALVIERVGEARPMKRAKWNRKKYLPGAHEPSSSAAVSAPADPPKPAAAECAANETSVASADCPPDAGSWPQLPETD